MADTSTAGGATAETPEADRTEWARVLDQFTERHGGEPITIEVLDRTYGDLYEAERLPFAYASYDRKDDVVIVAVGGNTARYPVVLRHMIWHPTEVTATDDEKTGTAFRVVGDDGAVTLVAFHHDSG